MELSRREIELLISWGRDVFMRTGVDWSLEDDELLERLYRLDRLYKYQRAISTN